MAASVEQQSHSAELDGFRFGQYQWIGFDLDHTLVRYRLRPFYKLCHRIFVDWLTRSPQHVPGGGGGFPAEWFALCPLRRDFAVKGTVLDVQLGNVLLLDDACRVIRAYHGWTPDAGAVPVSPFQLRQAYPDAVAPFVADNDDHCVLSTYFITVWAQLFAVLVSRLDDARRGAGDFPAPYRCAAGYAGVLDALKHATGWQFADWQRGDYFPAIAAAPGKYLQRNALKPWLLELRKSSRLFVCTNSLPEYTELLLRHSFGDDWPACFDLVITNACKPAFFTNDDADFYAWRYHPDAAARIEALPGPVPDQRLALGGLYAFGSAKKLVDNIRRLDAVADGQPLSLLYAGDHIESDCLAPLAIADPLTTWHTIAIVEELEDLEIDFPHISLHPVVPRSPGGEQTNAAHRRDNQYWSCFFVDYGARRLTLLASKASKATLSVPSLDRLSLFSPAEPLAADHSIDFKQLALAAGLTEEIQVKKLAHK